MAIFNHVFHFISIHLFNVAVDEPVTAFSAMEQGVKPTTFLRNLKGAPK
jgi:uncharacterized membrane protein